MYPVTPFIKQSTSPRIFEAITGKPDIIASNTANGSPSRLEGKTNISAILYTSAISFLKPSR